ncbi:MAG TPA: proton-conducting transporter membrane subunit, partial [bacterium]|nr:proton-conducting transporter membrane subunit [bacterium]
AFLCVAPLGYVLAGFALGTTAALQGALLELACELPALAGLFYLAQWLKECAGTDDLGRLRGLGRRAPGAASAFLLLGAGLVGVPLFGGFYAKLYVFEAALRQQQWWLVLGLAGAYGFSLLAWGVLAWRLFQAPTRETPIPRKSRPALEAVLALLALAGLAMGLRHQALLRDVITPALPQAFQHWTPPVEDWDGKDVE